MRHNIFDSIPSNIVSGKDNVFANFLQTAGLYKSMKIDEDNIEDLILLLDGKVRISTYCKECKEECSSWNDLESFNYFRNAVTSCFGILALYTVEQTCSFYIAAYTVWDIIAWQCWKSMDVHCSYSGSNQYC